MIPLFITIALGDSSTLKLMDLMRRCGLQHARPIGPRRIGRVQTFQTRAPAVTGAHGCVRSLAFNLGRPVLMQMPAGQVARLVFPLRTHPADGTEFHWFEFASVANQEVPTNGS